jgi:DNA-directed RNA polymerase subunit N (RpoN/RPB10)
MQQSIQISEEEILNSLDPELYICRRIMGAMSDLASEIEITNT